VERRNATLRDITVSINPLLDLALLSLSFAFLAAGDDYVIDLIDTEKSSRHRQRQANVQELAEGVRKQGTKTEVGEDDREAAGVDSVSGRHVPP
jgi:hypothetical protein